MKPVIVKFIDFCQSWFFSKPREYGAGRSNDMNGCMVHVVFEVICFTCFEIKHQTGVRYAAYSYWVPTRRR